MGCVTVIDLVAGPGIGLLPMMALGPAFAGLIGGMGRTAFIGALSVALTLALSGYNGLLGERRGDTTLVSVSGVAVASLLATGMRQRREAELASVRSIAEAAQRVLLRPVPRGAGRLRVAVSYTSAVAEARIGGDLYEVVTSPHGVRIIVGDVQGKGLEAVESAAVVLGAFREAAYDEPDLVAVGERLERALDRHLLGEKFVTAVLAEVRESEGRDRAVLLNYGHPAPLVIRYGGEVRFAEPPERSLPLGLGLHGSEPPRPHEVPFAPGDQVLFYTDGVTEARDSANIFYPLDERAHLLKDSDPEGALESVRQDIEEHVRSPLHDDAAMLLLRYREGGETAVSEAPGTSLASGAPEAVSGG
ncbi:PP2C family protein-serine/threonine phosphatase [Streptomyces boncukensis]|uniref:SpoIIE family protein phosphatase n=1 Tax=Streptomyces boncukensis TaxID=2711219 RepID=A0A6G4WQL9_9ACTN|nr:PP2C family protein-serine/threonine phosphatase [Streptomyces boncukensis]NGO67556.1 SpoIIE family protein phosphatase [Streptomyces boncukensis]